MPDGSPNNQPPCNWKTCCYMRVSLSKKWFGSIYVLVRSWSSEKRDPSLAQRQYLFHFFLWSQRCQTSSCVRHKTWSRLFWSNKFASSNRKTEALSGLRTANVTMIDLPWIDIFPGRHEAAKQVGSSRPGDFYWTALGLHWQENLTYTQECTAPLHPEVQATSIHT